MNYILEEKSSNKSIYYKITKDEHGQELSRRKVEIPLYKIEKNDGIWFVLYDDNLHILSEPTHYLNYHMFSKSLTTRKSSAHALRLLYIFLSLYNYDIRDISLEKFNQLIKFLQGTNVNPTMDKTKTFRSNDTVNNYLGVYREFFKKTGIDCSPLFKQKTTIQQFSFENESSGTIERFKYVNNLRTNKAVTTIPKYISPDEFERLHKKAVENNDKLAQCMMRLMYCYGLRLGEVLGLTTEDLKEVSRDNTLVPIVILRNRVSDKEFQYAKNLGHVCNVKAYKSRQYQALKSEIIIDYSLFELICDYINEVHSPLLEKSPKKYTKGNADIVSLKNRPETNHYIFLNKHGNILSGQTWGNYLKEYFISCGIYIDTDLREYNLSHRFRHGFAMLHAHYREHPVNALQLQIMMRHKSLSSTMVYFNLTEQEEFELKENFVNELLTLVPSLKKGSDMFI